MPITWLIIALIGIAGVTFALSNVRSHGVDLDKAIEADIPRLVMAGHKIDAIRVYRRLHRVDLKAAKDAIDRLAATLPKPPKTS